MDVKLKGKIFSDITGKEASLIIPIGDYNIMILSDDNLGYGKGDIIRSELFVYHKDDKPSYNINKKIFGCDVVTADSETLYEAMMYCSRLLKRSLKDSK